MQLERLEQQIAFVKQIDKLKYIQRKTRLFNSDRHENDAEHSWHLAMMAMVLAEHANGQVDLLKVIKMVLIHDIVEIDAGDTFLYDTSKSHINTEEELIAAKRIFGMLPEEQAQDLLDVWVEFESGQTAEARFAKALDRLQPILQNVTNGGGTWKEFEIQLTKILQKVCVIEKGSSILWDYGEEQILDTAKKGHIRTE